MHIIVVCPYCAAKYQLEPSLRGKTIYCPNAACRKVFTIGTEPPAMTAGPMRPPTPPPENGQRSGTVGDMVPILPAEAAPSAPKPADGSWWQAPPPVRGSTSPTASTPQMPAASQPAPPTATPEAAPWWGDAPPPVRTPQARTDAPAAPPAQTPPTKSRRRPEASSKTSTRPAREHPAAQTQPMTAIVPEVSEQPRELPPGVWEPPPVRRGPGAAAEAETQVTTEPEDSHAPRVSKRHARRIMAVILLLVFGVLGVSFVMIYRYVTEREGRYYNAAKDEYQHGQYLSAAAKFRELHEKFPTSERADEYHFREEWSVLCNALTESEGKLGETVDKFDQFLKDHKKDPPMEEFPHDAGQMLIKVIEGFAKRNANPTSEEVLQDVQRLEQVRETVEGFGPEALSKADSKKIDEALGGVRVAMDRWRERQKILRQLSRQQNEKPIETIKRAELVLQNEEKKRPGFRQDNDVQTAMARLYEEHFASVVYKPRREAPPPGGPERPEDEDESLTFVPLVGGSPGRADRSDPIVLALVRGVLYALRRSNGEIKWAARVGTDTTVLPLRVPASLGSSERILVMSADTRTLTARNTEGDRLWDYHVGQPVLGKPVIIKQRAYLAAYDGWVHEIELAEGNLVGRYDLGHRLTNGGAHETGTDRIYFPADDLCVYVLDVAQHRCVNILYDGHRSGSLRSEPVVIPPEGEATPGYLILNQTSGLDAMQLRIFELPLQDRHAAPLALNPPAQLHGWTWFEPFNDGEKMVVLSDAGILGLFGIKQAGNRDQALFPLLQPGGLDLSPFLRPAGEDTTLRGRSQVVQMQDNFLWVLAHGRLQQMRLLWTEKEGPQAFPGWDEPLVLGSPLHAPQTVEDRTGRSTFFLVTQPLERQTCLASAVTDEGKLLWQRQLGLVCQGEPLALKSPQGGQPMLLALDQGGGLFSLDPALPAEVPLTKSWQSIAKSLDDNPRFPTMLLPAPDGHSAYAISAPGEGKSLIVRHVQWAAGDRRLVVTERPVSLIPAAGGPPLLPVGTPSVVGGQLIVPMSEGYLMRVPLPIPEEQARFESGANWRARQASPNAPGYVLALGGDRFLTTDGARGLAVWEWPMDKTHQPLPETRGDLTLELSHYVTAPPLLLPAKPGSAPQILVADSAGVLHLLALTATGELQNNREWPLKGQFTGSPFLRVLDGSVRIGCLLDQRRLVWLDPAKPEPLWTYQLNGEAIVGQPQVIEKMLVLAFQSGRYVGLDLGSGQEEGPGYTLRASVAPAATPVSYGRGLMFAPLSDGTALMLPLERLRKPKGKD